MNAFFFFFGGGGVNVTFYDAVSIIHDVITTPNPFPYKAKFMFVGVRPQESDVYLVKIAECQPKWSLSIIKYTRNATDFGSKFDTTVTENHL